MYGHLCNCTYWDSIWRNYFLRLLTVPVYGWARVTTYLTRDASRRKLQYNDLHFLLVGKLAELLMLDLATSSSHYGEGVITASPVGHGERDRVASPSRGDFTVPSFEGYALIAWFMRVSAVCFSVLSLLFCVKFPGLFLHSKKKTRLFLLLFFSSSVGHT